MIPSLGWPHHARVALSMTSSAHFNAVNRHVATWRTQKIEYPVMVEYDPGSHANCGICEPLEQEEDTDSEAEAYGNPTASNEPLRPWQEQNYTIGVGSSAESLLGNQMKTNPRFLRDIAKLLIGNEEGSPIMIGGFITGTTIPWDMARLLNYQIGSGKHLDPRSNFGRHHTCSRCSKRIQGLSFAAAQFERRNDDPIGMACHAEDYGAPPFRINDWKLKDPIVEIHFYEICRVNLLGGKCKRPLPKVN